MLVILIGKVNEEAMKPTNTLRLAMTMPVMKILKSMLSKNEMYLEKKRLIWIVSTFPFHGTFRENLIE